MEYVEKSVKLQLKNEFDSEIKSMGAESIGSEEHKSATDASVKLADRLIKIEEMEKSHELKKIELENTRIMKEREIANNYAIKQREIEIDKRDKLVRNLTTIGMFAVGLAWTAFAHCMDMTYDQDGVQPTFERIWESTRKRFDRFTHKNQ